MSSLAAARADNFYHPPDWDPQKESRRKFQNAKGINQFEEKGLIRMEMPYNVYCDACQKLVGKGVRFNAKKEAAGKYFSTKIWRFTMYCSHDGPADSRRGNCANPIVIETDPKNTEYKIIKGATRSKAEDYDATDAGTVEMIGKDEREKIEADPFTKLEHKQGVIAKNEDLKPRVANLKVMADAKWGDDYSVNQALRRKFRVEKKDIKQADEQRDQDVARVGVPILPLTNEDILKAAAVRFQAPLSAAEHSRQQRLAILGGPIIAGGGSRPQASGSQSGEQGRLKKIQDRITSSWQAADKRTLEKKKLKLGPAGPPPKRPRMMVKPKQ